jgi:hypothetical protein
MITAALTVEATAAVATAWLAHTDTAAHQVANREAMQRPLPTLTALPCCVH